MGAFCWRARKFAVSCAAREMLPLRGYIPAENVMSVVSERLHHLGLSGSAAFPAIAASVAFMFMGSTLVTPLYDAYSQAFGFSEVTLTLIYSVYAVGNLFALLIFGRVSDQIGRRPVDLAAIAIAGLATVLFLLATGIAWLFAARLVSGFAIGLASGTGAAWLAELTAAQDKSRATRMAAEANFAGLAVGPLLAGLLAQYAPWPLHLPFLVYLCAAAIVAVLVQHSPETVRDPARSMREVSLRPRIGIPRGSRTPFIAPAVTAFATFAFIGFYAALIPGILTEALHQTSKALAGGVVFELFLVSTITVAMTRGLESRTAMLLGLALFVPSVALLVTAQVLGSLALLLACTALGGASAALGFRGSLQMVNQLVPAERRAEIISTYYLITFVGNSLPVIGVGIITSAASRLAASISFAATIAILATAALVTGYKFRPQSQSA
jgi:MFS family permease